MGFLGTLLQHTLKNYPLFKNVKNVNILGPSQRTYQIQ